MYLGLSIGLCIIRANAQRISKLYARSPEINSSVCFTYIGRLLKPKLQVWEFEESIIYITIYLGQEGRMLTLGRVTCCTL